MIIYDSLGTIETSHEDGILEPRHLDLTLWIMLQAIVTARFTWREICMYRTLLVVFLVVVVCFFVGFAHGSNQKAKEYFREGYLAAMAREWDSAIALFTKSIELDPHEPEVYVQRAAALQMAGRLDEAIADYERTLELKPDHYLALEYLAKLYEGRGQYEKAVALYARALPLVTDAKWRTVVKWWMAQAKSRIAHAKGGKNNTQDTHTRPNNSRHR